MTELINLNKRASLDKLSMLSGAVLAARVGVSAPATRSVLRSSQAATSAVASSAVVFTKDADSFPLFAIWLAGVGLFGLGVSASRFWNAMSSQSTSPANFGTKSRNGSNDVDEFDDPDYLDSVPLSLMSGPLSATSRDAMQWNIGRASERIVGNPRLNRVEAALFPALFKKNGVAMVPVTGRARSSERVSDIIAGEIGNSARICYTRACRPVDAFSTRAPGYVMVVYAKPHDSNYRLAPNNFDLGIATIPERQTVGAGRITLVSSAFA